ALAVPSWNSAAEFWPPPAQAIRSLDSMWIRLAVDTGVMAWGMYWSPSVLWGIVSSKGTTVAPVVLAPVWVRATWTTSPGRLHMRGGKQSWSVVGPLAQVPAVARPLPYSA